MENYLWYGIGASFVVGYIVHIWAILKSFQMRMEALDIMLKVSMGHFTKISDREQKTSDAITGLEGNFRDLRNKVESLWDMGREIPGQILELKQDIAENEVLDGKIKEFTHKLEAHLSDSMLKLVQLEARIDKIMEIDYVRDAVFQAHPHLKPPKAKAVSKSKK